VNKFSILVSSTDYYEDCWYPFFKLFKYYWSDYNGKIYLLTEKKDFVYDGLDIFSLKIGYKKKNKPYTWSESLKIALSRIDTPIVLLILDDLFLNRKVNTEKIEQLVGEMLKKNISVIYLTDQSTNGPFEKKGELLWKLSQTASNRISALIALWNKEKLKLYLKDHENPWQFEIYGTKRSMYMKDSFYIINPEKYGMNKDPIISHCYPTGITRGKWNREAVENLFYKHNIKINFNKRGFYYKQEKSLKQKIISKLDFKRFISNLKSNIQLLQLRINSKKIF